MHNDAKPRRVKAKVTATVTMTAYVILDRNGQVQEIDESDEILDYDDIEIKGILSVITTHP